MVIYRVQDSGDDHMSDCRSFGSKCHPWSQSRKISIGVMVDSSVNARSKTRKEDEAVVPNAEKVPSNVNSMVDGSNGEGAKVAIKRKQTTGLEHESSPWVSTRSLPQEKKSLEAIHYADLTMDLPAGGGMSNRLNGVKAAPTTYSVQFFANQMSVLQSGDGREKNFDTVSYRREGGKNGTKERVEEISSSTAQERFVPDKEVVQDKTNSKEDRRETLRIQLWDILGTVPSPNKQVSQALELGVNNSNLEQNTGKKKEKSQPVVKPRQNSDNIETDSESPDHAIRRPVTRSLTRKRAPRKVQTKIMKHVPFSTYARKQPEHNIFSFEEGFSGRLDAAVTGGSPQSYRMKGETKGFKTEVHNICPAKDNADNIQQGTDMSKTTKCALKTSSIGSIMERLRSYPPENQFVEVENGIRKEDSLQLSSGKVTDQLGTTNNSTSPQHGDQQEDLANSSLKDIVDSHVDLESPTFEFRMLTKSFSPSSPPETNHGELDDHSPSHCSFNSLLASKPDYYKADVGTESSDDVEELENSPLMKSQPNMEEKDAEYRLSESSSEETELKSSKEGSPTNEGRGTESLSLGTGGKPDLMFYPSKKLWNQEDITFTRCSPTSASPKGTEESNGLLRPSCQNQDAIAPIALALERIKSKVKSFTSKKTAEVLMSVAEGIDLQFQNAECQIQRDVGKLTSLGKSKRKRLEAEFEEQKEQLKLIYQKFEVEVNQHIQECRSTVEGLEAHETEFRGFIEKQKTSQRKLLKQVEEAIDTQLNEGQRRITALHKLAREKVLQLRYAVAECLEEGVLS